jgi:hypothetical protein
MVSLVVDAATTGSLPVGIVKFCKTIILGWPLETTIQNKHNKILKTLPLLLFRFCFIFFFFRADRKFGAVVLSVVYSCDERRCFPSGFENFWVLGDQMGLKLFGEVALECGIRTEFTLVDAFTSVFVRLQDMFSQVLLK